MIWLASYPRSGNTFFRNILLEQYGLTSGSYHNEAYKIAPDCFDQPFVKTHLLPDQLPLEYADWPAVYLVRDGRDSILSLSHHRKDLVDPESDLNQNMTEATIAAHGSHFGGWSFHASQWMKRASIIIRFEDLIRDPLGEVEKIRQIYPELPEPNGKSVPTFKEQKEGKSRYGVEYDEYDSQHEAVAFSNKFFRSGKTLQWKTKLPTDLKTMFWGLHGRVSEKLGYPEHGEDQNLPALSTWTKEKNIEYPRAKVLIAASKLSDVHIDGTKRYIDTLLKGFSVLNRTLDLPIDIYIQDHGLVKFDSYSTYVEERSWISRVIRLILTVPMRIKEGLPLPLFQFFWKVCRKLGIIGIISRGVTWRRNRQIARENFDLIHYTTPVLHKAGSAKLLTTIHDIVFEILPHFQPSANVTYHKKALRDLIKKKSHFLTVSNHTQHDLLSFYNLKEETATMVYEAIDHERFFPVLYEKEKSRVLKKYDLKEDQYFLFLSTIEPRKNIKNTLQAFDKFQKEYAHLKLKFVLAGAYGWMMEDLELPDNVVRTGFIPDEDLNVVLGSAIALCYVSYYEGFGLPPLEAMRCKTVPIYGRNSSMVELIGDCGLPADPDDVEEIAQQMTLIATDKELRKRMEVEAYQKSWEFTIEKTCRDTLNLYLKTVHDGDKV